MYNLLTRENTSLNIEKDKSLFNILRGFEEFILNKEGLIISSNLEVVNITGYEEWEVIGNHISIFYSLEDRQLEKPEAELALAAAQGQLIINDWRVKKRNARFWAKMKISSLKDDNGMHTGFRVVLKDTTHKALYNHRVKRIKDEYLNLFNNAYTGIFKFRMKDLRILLLNEKAVEILGRDESGDIAFQDLFVESDRCALLCQTLYDQAKVENFEFQISNTGRDEKWVSISCRYFAEQGFVEGILIDITESKRQVTELQKLNHELDQFIYHASHDLRSPLTTILGLVNLIHLDEPSPLIKNYAQLISERVHHLDGLLKDLVSITYNNKTKPLAESIHIETEVRTLLKEFHHQYNQVHAYLNVTGDAVFTTDVVRFKTILRNLISNALKYHNPQANPPFVKISVAVEAQQLVLTVEDNGLGIDQAYVDQIFGMFFRATIQAKGTGLGLFITKAMVDKLGGKIMVKSQIKTGTTFYVELPALMC